MIALAVSIGFEERQTDLSLCTTCEDVIYGKMFVLVFREDDTGRILENKVEYCFCESCYHLMEIK